MPGAAGRDLFIGWVGLAAAGIAGDGVDHAGGVLEYALHAPEAAARDHGGLQAVGRRNVRRGRGDHDRVLGGARGDDDEGGDCERPDGGGRERKAAELAHGMSSLGTWKGWVSDLALV